MTFEIFEFLNSGCLFSAGPRFPDRIQVAWGEPLSCSHAVENQFSVYSPDFFLEDFRPWSIFPESLPLSRAVLIQALEKFSAEFHSSLSEIQWNQPSYEVFSEIFLDLQSRIHSGDLKKGVPVFFERAPLQVTSELRVRRICQWILKMLSNTQNVPVYPYGIWNLKQGILGATPELLFRQSSHQDFQWRVETVALAGTRLNSSSRPLPFIPLIQDPKELEEHQIVIDGIQSSLRGLGSLFKGETRELTLPSLSHLFTPLTLELNSSTRGRSIFEELVTRLHPTPALGAFPRQEGAVWLRSLQERGDRLKFGAPFGVLGAFDEGCCVVSIRNIQWKDSVLLIGAGCGVIAASQLDREWNEVLGKIQSIQRIFGMEDLP